MTRWRPGPETTPADELLTALAAALVIMQERARRQGELAAWRTERAARRLQKRLLRR